MMTNSTVMGGGPEHYREAADDAAHGRDTPAARAIVAEARAALQAGQPLKAVTKMLTTKGAVACAADMVVTRANRPQWEESLTAASVELATGRLDGPNLGLAVRCAVLELEANARLPHLRERLLGYGATEALADHLLTHPRVRARARAAGLVLFAVGAIVAGAAVLGYMVNGDARWWIAIAAGLLLLARGALGVQAPAGSAPA